MISKYRNEKIFVSWKLVEKDGKMTKLPITYQGNLASSTDPVSWATYDDIKSKFQNVGIVLHDKRLICIDIDHVIEDGKIVHDEKYTIAELILEADTYTEISQSGTGIHIFIESTEPFILDGGNKKGIYEIYNSGRYMALTENSFGEKKELRVMTPDQITELLKIIGYPWRVKVEKAITTDVLPPMHEDILLRMFTSKNGEQIKALYNGDLSKFNNDRSLADASLLSHLAFWTGKNAFEMERIWASSPLGVRQKTQNRKDYRDRSIANAINKCVQVYKPKTLPIVRNTNIEFLVSTKFTPDGIQTTPMVITENLARVLRFDPKYKNTYRYDEFKCSMEVLDKGVWRGQESNDSIILQTKISTEYPEFSKVGKDMISDAIILVSKENTIDSAKQYVTSCVWDKTPRLDSWLTMVYGAEDNKYHQAVGSNWLKGMVKRIMEPGCKFDHILVLEGEQGSKKSTSLSVLGGSWHVETTMSTENKDFFMQFQGKAIIEFSEGETLNRTEVKRMKAIITTQYDKYRPPYERLSQDFPRRCVFAMTTNESEYLKDETGNRRWLPVTLVKPEADVEWLASNRDQLFAEAFYRLYTLKETVHEFPKEETRDEQAKRRIQDPNSEAIVDWYVTSLTDEQRRDGVTANMAFDKVIKGGSGKSIDRLQEMIIGGVFRESLKLEKRRIKKNGVQAWRWFSKLETLPASDDLDVKNW